MPSDRHHCTLPRRGRVSTLALVLAFVLAGITAAGAGGERPPVVDGTFWLRSRKADLDREIRARLATDPRFAALYRDAGRVPVRLQVGSSQTFLVYNFATSSYESRTATLRLSGRFCHIFVADDSRTLLGTDSATTLEQIRKHFDEKIYPTITDWFGTVDIPTGYSLPDARIYILLCDIRDGLSTGYVAGYFDSRDLDGSGNRKPVFFMDLHPGRPGDPNDKNNDFYKTLAHEFQHMINYSKHLTRRVPQEDRWVEEGLSGFAEYVYTARVGDDGIGLPPTPHLARFLENPNVELTTNDDQAWFQASTLFRQYGASFLFMYYLQEKFGGANEASRKAFVRQIVDNSSVGINGLNAVLAQQSAPTNFQTTLRHWFVANHLNDPSLMNGLWGYVDKERRLGREADGLPVKGTPLAFAAGRFSFLGGEGEVLPNAARYVDLSGSGRIALSFRGDPRVFTPFVATVDQSSPPQAALRDISLAADTGSGTLELDLGALRRAILIPAVATTSTSVGSPFLYQFSGQTANLILYPIPNPAFTKDFLIVVKSLAGPLPATPTVTVRFNNLTATPPPEMQPTDASRSLFVGSYHIPPGSGEGLVTARIGQDESSFAFFHNELTANVVARLTVGEAELAISSRVDGDHASLFETTLTDVPPELRLLSKPYYAVFNGQNALEARLQFAAVPALPAGGISVGASTRGEPGEARRHRRAIALPLERDGQLGLWSGSRTQGEWSPVSRNERGVFGAIRREGAYLLVADTTRPRIHDLHLDRGNLRPTLMARLSDLGSGIDPDTLRVEADGTAVPFTFDPASGQLEGDLTRLPAGTHRFSVEVADRAGNLGRALLTQVLAGPLRVRQATAFPNPARGFTTLAVILDGTGADDPTLEVEARLYDTAGGRLLTIPLEYKSNHTFAARWDCRTDEGRAVANGVYPFKIVIRRGDEELKATGSVAVLR